jgi:hypothetical protein
VALTLATTTGPVQDLRQEIAHRERAAETAAVSAAAA